MKTSTLIIVSVIVPTIIWLSYCFWIAFKELYASYKANVQAKQLAGKFECSKWQSAFSEKCLKNKWLED